MPKSLSSVVVVVPAAGRGSRMGVAISKQYLVLAGKPVLQHCLEKLLSLGLKKIVLVVSPEDEDWRKIPQTAQCLVVNGGEHRVDSVRKGLEAIDEQLEGQTDDWVMVHDCARPCVRSEDILKLFETVASSAVGGLLGVPVIDTLKEVTGQQQVIATRERADFWLAQTPQMFRLGLLQDALVQAERSHSIVTDEASAVELLGHQPLMIQGSRDNIKITTQEDLALAEYLLGQD